MSAIEEHELRMAAEEDVASVMLHLEAGDHAQARAAVNAISAGDDGWTRMAWAILRLAEMLHRQETKNEEQSVKLRMTDGIKPAGLSREDVARIALESDRRTADLPRKYEKRVR